MINETITSVNGTRARSSLVQLSHDGTCNVIQHGNATLAANWENIPETVILNATIGAFLFVLFLLFTWIAWRRVDTTGDKLHSQNIISFLYGYRDPEQWYVIPRFEFLRREDRHHQHDLQYPYLYVPPKLPLANPFDVFADATGPEHSNSVDSTSNQDNKVLQTIGLKTKSLAASKADISFRTQAPQRLSKDGTNRSTISNTASLDTVLSDSPIQQASQIILPTGGTKNSDSSSIAASAAAAAAAAGNAAQETDTESKKKRGAYKSSALNQSFFYPSILTAEQLQASYLSRKLNRIFSIFFRVTDAEIIYSRGIDAYEYLLFQRHLILVMFITCVLCLGVILPIHWIAGKTASTTSFQQTIIKNISSNQQCHWAHLVCSTIIILCTLFIMNSYRESIISRDEPQISRRTLLIGNIPVEQRTRTSLHKILNQYFPRNTIEAIQFVYDTSSLIDYEMYLSSTIVAKNYCLAYKRKYDREIYVRNTDVNLGRVCDGYCRCCSFIYICCCFWPYESMEPGSVYYAKEEQHYREKISQACEKLVREPTEYAFVTFKSHKMARKVMLELANIKQDAIDGKSSLRSSSRSVRSGELNSLDGLNTNKMFVNKNSNNQVDDSGALAKGSKLIVVTSNQLPNDPLDPKNNPHVRSIRSPKSPAHITTSQVQLTKHVSDDTKQLSTTHKSVIEVKGHKRHIHDSPVMWSARYAPHPDNVEFHDLVYIARRSKYTITLLHLLTFIIFVFITTPNVVLSILERISVLNPDKIVQLTGFEGLIINYVSILLQIITTALLPALVTLISKQIPHEDSSTKNHSVMWKVYAYLVLMVIIMPSAGMTSAQAFFELGIDPECLFPTDNGAYYINYVISSIFLSTVLELIKPIDILSYYFILWTSRSTAEIEGGRQFIEREFSVGMQHTSVLLIFSVVMTYAMSCPLIAPVGLIYLIVKHAVDHYNLYYTYFTKKVDKDLQSTIVIFVKVALLLMLFQTTIAIYINTGASYFSLIAQIIFWITLAGFVFNCFFDCTTRSMPPSMKRARFQNEFCACFYLPRVLASLLRSDAIPTSCVSRKV